MATQHNFRIKNGLEVAGTVRITSAGLITGTTTTQAASDNTTKLASTAYVTTALANLSDSAPSTLNTLNELAAALGDDANYATTTTNAIAAKLPLTGGTLTGALTGTSAAFNSGTTNVVASFTSTDGTGAIQLADNGGSVELSAVGNDFHIQNAGAAAKMVVLNSGNVGIGEASPSRKLHINGPDGTTNLVEGNSRTALFLDNAGATYQNFASANNANAGIFFSDTDANNRGAVLYKHGSDALAFTTAAVERMSIANDGYITLTSTRSEYALELNSASNRAGLVVNKPGTSSTMGSVLMLSGDETFRLGTASNYHVRMDQSGNTYMGNTSTTRFTQNGNLSVNTTTANSGITSGTDVRALGPCFANDANSFTMSQEGSGNTDAYLAARGTDGSTRGNIHIGVSVSGGGNFKSGLVVDNQGRSTTPENPAFRYRATAAQVLNSGWQQVGYGTLKEERGTGYSSANSRFTAPVAGWYQFNAAWTANSNADNDGTLAIWINGSSTDLVSATSMPDTGGSYEGHFCGGCCYLDVNDYVQVHRYSNVATTTRSSAPYGGWFSGFLIG